MDVGSFGSKLTHESEPWRPKTAYNDQADVPARSDLRGAGKEPTKILVNDSVFRMPVKRRVDICGGKDRVRGMTERLDDLRQGER
jgi:hypothetical protein